MVTTGSNSAQLLHLIPHASIELLHTVAQPFDLVVCCAQRSAQSQRLFLKLGRGPAMHDVGGGWNQQHQWTTAGIEADDPRRCGLDKKGRHAKCVSHVQVHVDFERWRVARWPSRGSSRRTARRGGRHGRGRRPKIGLD
eukprot:scaffold14879_cov122-Isochrysis_galbana.AAC.4